MFGESFSSLLVSTLVLPLGLSYPNAAHAQTIHTYERHPISGSYRWLRDLHFARVWLREELSGG